MSVILNLHPKVISNLKVIQSQIKRKSINQLCTEIISDIASGKSAYILLTPAPPPEVYEEVANAVSEVMKKHGLKDKKDENSPESSKDTSVHVMSEVSDGVSPVSEVQVLPESDSVSSTEGQC